MTGTDHDVLAGARKAASVIVLRDVAAGGFEVLMMRRAERDGDFRSGAAVFPGGALDAADAQAHAQVLGWTDAQASTRMRLPSGGLDYLVAAARECFEEAGLLFATPLDEPRLATAHAQWRVPMQQGQRTVSELCAHLDVRIDLRDWLST
jgi:8-oxo-dGTP pyrophosphatase MutT (NUDIX family)